MLTGTDTARVEATGVTGYDYAAFYYDERGRIIQSRTTNHLGGTEVEYVTYNFIGDPLKRQHVHTATGKATQTEVCTYEYDHAGRLSKSKHKLNTNGEVTLIENTYDDLGRIKSCKRHGMSALTTSYTYNIRSWLKSQSTGTLFNQTLYYNESYGGNTPCYNGNISAMSWKASDDTGLHGYRFRYDGLSRLTSADYLWNGISSTNYSTSYTYNKQSNITSLRRNGRTGASSYGLIDNLTFTLDGNKLTRTDDAATATAYNGGFEFKDAVKQADEYAYDKNGNMTKDLNKDITDIQYNCLNLPSKVTFKDGSTITYTYALNGTKLRTVHKIGNTTTTTDYCGNVVYENGVQKLLLTDAGYITLSDKKYHYYLQDHQGNNRVIVDQTGQKKEVNHYYPFGGTFASADGNVQAYKYNGKELDTKKGLNWYDYGARQYDPALGRFTAVDPLTEKYYEMSPYTYCGNNPIKYIDPTGMFYTGYTVNEKGHIKIVSDEGGNYYDVLYNESSYSVKTVKNYDTSGDKTGIKISKGILNERAGASRNMSAKTMKGPYLDVEGHKTGRSYANHSYEIRSDKESLALMNFLDKNTSVEWANTLMKDTQDNSVNLLSTSHHETTVEGGSHQIIKYINKGFQVIRADHIHPTPGAIDPSGEKGDMGHAANILKHSPNAIFRILNQGRYYTYKP